MVNLVLTIVVMLFTSYFILTFIMLAKASTNELIDDVRMVNVELYNQGTDNFRWGVVTGNRAHVGDVAAIYADSEGKDFIGYFECLDVGETLSIKTGNTIGIYVPDYVDGDKLIKLTGGKVLIRWYKGNG